MVSLQLSRIWDFCSHQEDNSLSSTLELRLLSLNLLSRIGSKTRALLSSLQWFIVHHSVLVAMLLQLVQVSSSLSSRTTRCKWDFRDKYKDKDK